MWMGQIFFGTDSANLQFFTHHCIGSIWHLSVSPASPTAAPGEHFLAAEALGNLQVLYLYLYFVFVFGQPPGFGFVFVFCICIWSIARLCICICICIWSNARFWICICIWYLYFFWKTFIELILRHRLN